MKKTLFNSNLKTILIFSIFLFYGTGGFSENLIYDYKGNANPVVNSFNLNPEEPSIYWLNLTSDYGHFNQMVVGYTSEATLGIDYGIDGLNINSKYYLCSIIDGSPYTIQGRPLFTLFDEVPIVFKIAMAGEYSIAIDRFTSFFENQDIYLKDKLENTIHNLKSGPYTFSSDIGTFNDRFEIVYQNSLAVKQDNITENKLEVYKENQYITIQSGNKMLSRVEIYDLNGRLLNSIVDINTYQVKFFTGNTTGALIVKVLTQKGETIIKKLIN